MSTSSKSPEFRPNDYVVYPAHGVGQIMSIDEQEIAGISLRMFVISFEKDKMTLRVPIDKASSVGMRTLSSPDIVGKAMDTLKGRARVKRAMWSRRAQEYEQKINSGDLISIAEVVRDLHRNDEQREQSYSERQLYEAALERLTRELAVVNGLEEYAAQRHVGEILDSRAAAA
ncbi:MAG: CarD family transcriptional regulator [Pseudomonadota bacterium]